MKPFFELAVLVYKGLKAFYQVAGEEDIFISTNARLVKPTKFLLEF